MIEAILLVPIPQMRWWRHREGKELPKSHDVAEQRMVGVGTTHSQAVFLKPLQCVRHCV